METSYDYDPDTNFGRPESRRNMFADPGGKSALRSGRRKYPCPTCERPNMLTAQDIKLGYQCDCCADLAEGGAS